MPALSPAEVHTLFADYFSGGKIEDLCSLYEPDAILLPRSGPLLRGVAAIRPALCEFVAMKGTLGTFHLVLSRVVQVNDIAILFSDWVLTASTPDGSPSQLSGCTSDVVRRQADGHWRFVIDDPFGTARIAASADHIAATTIGSSLQRLQAAGVTPGGKLRMATLLAQAGAREDPRTGAISTPIYQTATFAHPALGRSTGFDYSRTINPTRKALEDALARLDKGVAGFAFASGLAALTTALCLLSAGDHLVVAEGCYGGTYRLLDQVFSRFGIAASYVPPTDLASYRAAIRPQTRAILVESVSNPCLLVPDLPALVTIAHDTGALLLVDNTFLTPYWLRPLELGADIVLHSASKFLAGHNDVIGGIVTVRDTTLADRVGYLQNSIGAVLGPQDAWLVLRGLKTLALRLEQQQRNALTIATWLRQQPRVTRVYYSGLPDDRGHSPLTRVATGFGAVLAFEVDQIGTVRRLIEHLGLIAYAESLGGVESLITVPALQTHANLATQERIRLGVTDTLLRLSVGIEAVEDLIADLASRWIEEV